MKKNSITEFELERQDSKIKLKRGLNGNGSASQNQQEDYSPPISAPIQSGVSAPVVPVVAPLPVATGEIEVKSPMIGTFYRAPSPEAGNYVEVGTEIGPETVVCIIEAMK